MTAQEQVRETQKTAITILSGLRYYSLQEQYEDHEYDIHILTHALLAFKRDGLEEAVTLCEQKARYYKALQRPGQINDVIALRCATDIRAQATALKEPS